MELVAHLPAGVLVHGDNTVEVTGILNEGIAYSLVLANNITVEFEHLYVAESDYLECHSRGARTVTVQGLRTPDIDVFDLSDPTLPRRLDKVRVNKYGSEFFASF